MAKLDPFKLARLLGKSPSAAGRALEKKRPRWRSTCVVCQAPFIGVTHRKYCSPRCKLIAWRARQKEKRSE